MEEHREKDREKRLRDGTSQGEIHHPCSCCHDSLSLSLTCARARALYSLAELRGQWWYAAEPLLETRYMHSATSQRRRYKGAGPRWLAVLHEYPRRSERGTARLRRRRRR